MFSRTKNFLSFVTKRTKIPFQPLPIRYYISNEGLNSLQGRFNKSIDQDKLSKSKGQDGLDKSKSQDGLDKSKGQDRLDKSKGQDNISSEKAQVAAYDFTSEDLINSDYGLASYMHRVYKTTGLSIGFFLGGGYLLSNLGLAFSNAMIHGGFGLTIAGFLGFYLISQVPGTYKMPNGKLIPTLENPISRKLCFSAIIAGLTISMSPLIGVFSIKNPMIIPAAAILTTSVMAGSTLYALKAKHGSFNGWSASLYGGLLGLVGLNIISLLTYGTIGPNIFSMMCGRIDIYFGIGLFTAYQMYDTQNAIKEYKEGKYDHLNHSLNFFLNFINLFSRIAEILGSDDNSSDHKNRQKTKKDQ